MKVICSCMADIKNIFQNIKMTGRSNFVPYINSCHLFSRKTANKLKLEVVIVQCNIYKEAMTAYNKATHQARKEYFSKNITENVGNSKILFSTIDQLLKTAPTLGQASALKCEELVFQKQNSFDLSH